MEDWEYYMPNFNFDYKDIPKVKEKKEKRKPISHFDKVWRKFTSTYGKDAFLDPCDPFKNYEFQEMFFKT